MGLVLSTINMKGGVGKTTLTVNLAAALVKYYQKRVLIVDIDAQISATLSVIPPHDFARVRKARRTLNYLLDKIIRPYISRKFSTADMILESVCDLPGMDLLPGDIELYDEHILMEMIAKKVSETTGKNFKQIWSEFESTLLPDIINPIRHKYDFILIDCAPGYNLLTRSAILMSDFYLLPARPEPLSLVGIELLQKRIEKLKAAYDRKEKPHLLGILCILSAGFLNGRYYRKVIQRIEKDFTEMERFKTEIPLDVNVARAVDNYTPVLLSHSNCAGSKAFIRLTEEFLKKLEIFQQSKN